MYEKIVKPSMDGVSSAGGSAIFEGCQIVLEMGSRLSFKEKKALKAMVTQNGGILSYIITKKVTSNLS